MPLSSNAKVGIGAGVGILGGALIGLALLRSRVPTSPAPTPCTSNSQCPSGYICVSGSCVPQGTPPASCTSNSDCPTGYVCVNGQCVPGSSGPTPCTSNSNCPSGYVCVNGQCVVGSSSPPPTTTTAPVGCLVDAQCPTGMTCVGSISDSAGLPGSPLPAFYLGNIMGFCAGTPPSPLSFSSGPFSGAVEMCYPGGSPCPAGYTCATTFTFPWPSFDIDPIADTSNAGPVGPLQAFACYPNTVTTLPTPSPGSPGGVCSTNTDCGSFAPCVFGICQNPATWFWAADTKFGPIWINAYGTFPATPSPILSIPMPCTANSQCPPGMSCGTGPSGAGWCAGSFGGAPTVPSTCPGNSCPAGYTCTKTTLGLFCVSAGASLSSPAYGACLETRECPSSYVCAWIGYAVYPGDGGSWASQCIPAFSGATSADFLYTPSPQIPAACNEATPCQSGYTCFEGLCYTPVTTTTPIALNGGYVILGGWNDGGSGLATQTIQCVTTSDCPSGWNCLGVGYCQSVTGTSSGFLTPSEMAGICPPGQTCTSVWPQSEFMFSCANRATYGLSGLCPEGTICVGGACVSIPRSTDCGSKTGFQGGAVGYCGPNGIEPAWLRPCALNVSPALTPACPPGTSCYAGIATYPGFLMCNAQGVCSPIMGLCLQVGVFNGEPWWNPTLQPSYYNPNAKVFCASTSDCIPGFVCEGSICMCDSGVCATIATPGVAVGPAFAGPSESLTGFLSATARPFPEVAASPPWWEAVQPNSG